MWEGKDTESERKQRDSVNNGVICYGTEEVVVERNRGTLCKTE